MSDDDLPDLSELYGEFISENRELLEKLSRELVALEKSPEEREIVDQLFRSVHTIKGNAGFLGLTPLTEIAHRIENVLQKMREGDLQFFPSINDVFFRALDMASLLLDDFESGRESPRDLTTIENEIDNLLKGDVGHTVSGDTSEKPSLSDEDIVASKEDKKETASLRISTYRLDRMVNLAGELATKRGRLLQISHELKDEALAEIASSINFLSSQLQEEVLAIRMVPIKSLFNRFYRLVRDTSRALNKEAQLKVEGEETELDRSVMELLYEPLVHLVRNCIDHGLEEESGRSGKSRIGVITLSACHEKNSVQIKVGDDGAGLNPERIKRRALEKGLASREEIDALSDDRAARLIFASGFSTADKISDLSGRGVGMDVVKTSIEKMGGDVGLEWEEGRGTTVIIRVPLTLAIVQLFLVRAGGHIFGIPLHFVDETIRVFDEDLETMKGQTVYMLRHKAVPVLRMKELFNLQGDSEKVRGRISYNLLILNQMHMKAGMIVDEFMGKVETVIKPLGPFIDRLPTPLKGISGASILGTGEIALVVDIPAMWDML